MTDDDKVVTIQQTAKRWKGWWLITRLGIVLGLWLFMLPFHQNAGEQNTMLGAIGLLLIPASIIAGWAVKFGAWWHHG